MLYLILETASNRIMRISETLGRQENGNYLIHDGTMAIPESLCEVVEVATVPDGVEPERWIYRDGQFALNPDWAEPAGKSSPEDVDEFIRLVKEGG